MDACPGAAELNDLAAGVLPEPRREIVREHVRSCESCGLALAAMNRSSERDPGSLVSGDRIGRFELLRVLGAGSMGAVWEARDGELGRSVALKTLLPALLPKDGVERLLREARAMALLSHPNVVTVHDVIAQGDRIFIAMELVPGGTLRDWLAATPRKLDEILDVFAEAGAGLSAAHEKGLVHRDFKPENVLIDSSGRARVSDFGLARSSGMPQTEPPSPVPLSSPLQLTNTGALIGTPAYMAPEQMRGEAIDARADLFAFCTALYEAAYGSRPFQAANVFQMQQRIERNEVAPEPPKSRVPSWLRRALLKGLRAKPAERWASMAELLAAIDRGRQRIKRRRQLLIAAGALLAAGAAAYGFAARRSQLCSGAEQKVAGLWDGQRRERAQQAFAALAQPYADHEWQSVDAALTAFRDQWVSMRTEACAATRLRGEQSEELLDSRMQCLDQRLFEARDLVDIFGNADKALVLRANQAAQALTPVSVCADLRLLRGQAPLPADASARTKIESVRQQLAQAKALEDAGRYKAAVELADPAAVAAKAIGYRPLTAEALSRLALALSYLPESGRSASMLREAALASEAAARDDLAARDWSTLVLVTGEDERHPDEALRWADHAKVAIERLGGDDELEGIRELHLGSALSQNGRHDEAIPHLRTAVALLEKKPEAIVAVEGLASGLVRAHRNEEGLPVYERLLPIFEKEFGPQHPNLARLLINESAPLMDLNRLPEAEAALRRAVSILETTDNTRSYVAGAAWDNLGDCLRQAKKPEEAEREYRKAFAFYEERAPGKLQQVNSLMGIGGVLVEQHKPADALSYLERALGILEKQDGGKDQFGQARFDLARAVWDSKGDRKRALSLAHSAQADFAGAGLSTESKQVADWLASCENQRATR